jgi:predicted DNA-binding transcriptional regulator AlpA
LATAKARRLPDHINEEHVPVTLQTVEQGAPARKQIVLILAREFRRRLGGISNSTFWRLEKSDPRFPKPTWVRGQRAWPEDEADAYACELIDRTANGRG